MRCCLVLATILALSSATKGRDAAADEPVGVIFDTDLGADIDDALAMAMLHAFHDRGESRLLAVTLTNADRRSTPLAQIINHFYGHEVPVGRATNQKPAGSGYLDTVDLKDDGAQRYPHRGKPNEELPEAPSLLRKVLAAQPDGSVVIVQVGFFSNLAELLKSGPDNASPLSGKDLVRKKVRLLSIMGGSFTPIEGNSHFTEYNIQGDRPASIAVARDWPTPIVWSGFEIGIAVPYPAASIEHDFGYVAHHPVADAYRLYAKMPYDRPTWDLTSVLAAVRPNRGYFDLSPPGRVTVEADGFTTFEPAENGRDRYLVLPVDRRDRVTEALTQLVSQPPTRR
jgi:inosine-uridine nucleoside N-ribohydrolase